MFIGMTLYATTTEEGESFPIEYLSHIKNDGNDDVYVGINPLDVGFTGNYNYYGYFIISPGESVGGFKLKTSRLYFKSESGTQKIRVGGLTVY